MTRSCKVVAATMGALLTVLAMPSQVLAEPGRLWVESNAVSGTLTPPDAADARLTSFDTGAVVNAMTRLHPHLAVGGSGVADRVTAQVVVRGADGKARIAGPEVALTLGSARPSAAVSFDARTGLLTVRAVLTSAQADELADLRSRVGVSGAAERVQVRIRHEADFDATDGVAYETGAVVSAAGRWQGRALSVPMRDLRDTPGVVTVRNQTGHPVLVLAGPAECMYDNVYSSTQDNPNNSFLGALNGTILLNGRSVSAKVDKDANDLDGKDNDFNYPQVIADFAQALDEAGFWMQGQPNPPDYPAQTGQSGGTDYGDLGTEIAKFAVHAVTDVLGANGVIDEFFTLVATKVTSQAVRDAIETIADSFDAALGVLEVVFAIVQELVTFFTNGCDGSQGAFIIGATDITAPWRQFRQVYSWNGGNVGIASVNGKNYVALANGMLAQQSAPASGSGFTANNYSAMLLPTTAKAAPVWTFTEPPVQAQHPATISVNTSTRTVTCGLDTRDQGRLSGNLASLQAAVGWYVPIYPAQAWMAWNGFVMESPPGGSAPNDYLIGQTFVPNGVSSNSSVDVFSAAAQKWTNVQIPAGASSVTIPASIQATSVMCKVQAPESWNPGQSPLPTGRGILMGTYVPSSLVPGPDATG